MCVQYTGSKNYHKLVCAELPLTLLELQTKRVGWGCLQGTMQVVRLVIHTLIRIKVIHTLIRIKGSISVSYVLEDFLEYLVKLGLHSGRCE